MPRLMGRDARNRTERALDERDRARDLAVALEGLLARAHAEIHSIRCLDLDGINARREAETRLSALDDLLAGEGDT